MIATDNNLDLSIIVPVYNVEKYIRACILSIFRQDLEDNRFEVILVNDGTTDRSMEMIEDIISKHSNITIINQDNQGLSAARNTGLAHSKGKYIQFVDSDDMLINNSISELLAIAIEKGIDLLVASFISKNEKEITDYYDCDLQTHTNYIEKSGKQLFLEDLDVYECNVWRTIYRRSFLIENKIFFYPGIVYEDIPFTHECYLKAQKCIVTKKLIYIYRRRETESITSFMNETKANNLCIAIAQTWKLTLLNNISLLERKKLEDNVFHSFVFLLRCITYTKTLNSPTERTKNIDYIKFHAPNLYFSNNMKQIAVSLMYKYTPHLFIHFFYFYIIMADKFHAQWRKN